MSIQERADRLAAGMAILVTCQILVWFAGRLGAFA